MAFADGQWISCDDLKANIMAKVLEDLVFCDEVGFAGEFEEYSDFIIMNVGKDETNVGLSVSCFIGEALLLKPEFGLIDVVAGGFESLAAIEDAGLSFFTQFDEGGFFV